MLSGGVVLECFLASDGVELGLERMLVTAGEAVC
jgi:hypothetical protein